MNVVVGGSQEPPPVPVGNFPTGNVVVSYKIKIGAVCPEWILPAMIKQLIPPLIFLPELCSIIPFFCQFYFPLPGLPYNPTLEGLNGSFTTPLSGLDAWTILPFPM